MAEISKIKINDNDLIIKDATARNNIESLSTNIKNNYLPLTGGTLSGNLNLEANLWMKKENEGKTLLYVSANNQFVVMNRKSSSDSGEYFYTPAPEERSEIVSYNFLTTKKLVTASQGGTGVATATANKVFAGPTTGDAAAPSFRGLVANDIPNLNANKITGGILAVARGGTNAATASANQVFAGPSSGNAAAPSFRTLVATDIPNLNASKITSGTLSTARGGTGGSYDSITDFMQSALKINKFAIDSGKSRVLSIGSNELMVIFWMRETTYGYALITGYKDTVIKIIDVGGGTSPTIVHNTDTHIVTITNNRSSNLSVMVFGGTLHS